MARAFNHGGDGVLFGRGGLWIVSDSKALEGRAGYENLKSLIL